MSSLKYQASTSAALYDSRASNYNDSFHPQHAADFAKFASVQAGQHILDLACGTGLVSIPAALELAQLDASQSPPEKGSILGVDVASEMLAIARSDAEKAGVGEYITFVRADITALDSLPPGTLREGGYDTITCASAVPLLDKPGEAFKHWAQHLKPGGRLLVDVPTEKISIQWLVFEDVVRECGEKEKLPWSRRWIKDEGSLEGLVKAAGLEIEKSVVLRGYGAAGSHEETEGVEVFEKFFDGPMAAPLRELDAEFREKAKRTFLEKWERLAVDGKLKEEEGFYFVIGRKSG